MITVKTSDLGYRVIGAAIEVHRELGPGLLESTYERCLAYEFDVHGIRFEQQKSLPVYYKGVLLDCGYRIDMLIEDQLILELKSVETVHPVHEAQLMTYMKLSGIKQGFLVNFNVPCLKQGLKSLLL